MSDNARKGLGEQVEEKLTPDSQKSGVQKTGENVTGAYDKLAGAIQPESDKSPVQKLGDGTRSHADSVQKEVDSTVQSAKETATKNDGNSYVDSAKETAGDIVNAASDKLQAASDYVTGTYTDKKV